MKFLYLKAANEKLKLENNITSIRYDDCNMFRNFVKNISENIILSENNETIDIVKNCKIIFDPLNLELKDKKNTTELYKQIKHELTEEHIIKWHELEADILNLIADISIGLDYSIDYEVEADFLKILSLYQVSIKEEKIDNYLNYLINYIKIYSVFYNCNIFISIRLLSILNQLEFEKLEQELTILGITLVDFDINYKNSFAHYKIDYDWCVI